MICRRSRVCRHVVATGLLLLAGCGVNGPTTAPGAIFSRLIVFGDSGSDIGNLNVQSFGSIPDDPYFDGRFCNGPVWIDSLAQGLGLDLQASMNGGTDFALGAAASGAGLAKFSWYPVGPNLLEQIDLYRDQPDGSELFVIWAGVLDVFHTLQGDCSPSPDEVASNIATAINSLYDRGARSFLVGNLPDLGYVPFYNRGDQRTQASTMCAAINAALSAKLDQLSQLPGITLYRLDAASSLARAIADPPTGVTNVTDSAWSGQFTGYSGGGELASNPDSFLFWDFVHLGHAWHSMLGNEALSLIQGQPPPARNSQPAATTFQSPAQLDYWLTFLSLAMQPANSPLECRY